METAWSILQGPLLAVMLGFALAYSGISLLGEYRKLFLSDPKSVMSIEVLVLAVAQAGGAGYIADLCSRWCCVELLSGLSHYGI